MLLFSVAAQESNGRMDWQNATTQSTGNEWETVDQKPSPSDGRDSTVDPYVTAGTSNADEKLKINWM
jgi:hypothetical protein